jgi:hypothetical protein
MDNEWHSLSNLLPGIDPPSISADLKPLDMVELDRQNVNTLNSFFSDLIAESCDWKPSLYSSRVGHWSRRIDQEARYPQWTTRKPCHSLGWKPSEISHKLLRTYRKLVERALIDRSSIRRDLMLLGLHLWSWETRAIQTYLLKTGPITNSQCETHLCRILQGINRRFQPWDIPVLMESDGISISVRSAIISVHASQRDA